MKIIFLDIDGVLSISSYCAAKGEVLCTSFVPELVENLNKVIEQTNANIIISSAWRGRIGFEKIEAFHKHFSEQGFKYPEKIIGTTRGTSNSHDRGAQILGTIKSLWNRDETVENYVVIDDSVSDILPYIPKNKIVKTSFYHGLSDEHCEKAVYILNYGISI